VPHPTIALTRTAYAYEEMRRRILTILTGEISRGSVLSLALLAQEIGVSTTPLHNPFLIGILEGLWDVADRYVQVGLQSQKDSKKDRIRVQEEHIQIADAVIAGDAVRARETMQRHAIGSLGRKATSPPSARPGVHRDDGKSADAAIDIYP
jgi:DNA-binding GntR family transcriptional regulator